MRFDCLITNPPYADSSHSETKNTLWRKWFDFDHIVNPGGIFAEIIPSSWLGSPPIIRYNFLEGGILNKNITHLNVDECGKHFKGIGHKFSYFIYSKNKYSNETEITAKNIDNSITSFSANLNNAIFDVFPRDLSEVGLSILNKTLRNNNLLGIKNTTVCHGNNKHKWRSEPINEFIYPIERTPNNTIYYNTEHPHQNIPKIVIPTTTYFRSMYFTTNGTSQSFCYYNLKDDDNPKVVLNNINNKLFDYINECFRYSNWNSVNILKKLPTIPLYKLMTDEDIYEYFNLTYSEISHINNIISWR